MDVGRIQTILFLRYEVNTGKYINIQSTVEYERKTKEKVLIQGRKLDMERDVWHRADRM